MLVSFNGKSKNTSDIKRFRKPMFSNLYINFDITEKINDETRGVLFYFCGEYFFLSIDQYLSLNFNKKLKRLCLILESPHKSEFDSNNNPIRIANGTTGRKLESKITIKCKKWKLEKKYAYVIYLLNAIQYQCSCYKLLKDKWDRKNKKHVFKLLFSNKYGFGLCDDFVNRVKMGEFYKIINCVTSDLKRDVNKVLKENKLKIICDSHPSIW